MSRSFFFFFCFFFCFFTCKEYKNYYYYYASPHEENCPYNPNPQLWPDSQ